MNVALRPCIVSVTKNIKKMSIFMYWNGVNLFPLNRYKLICCQISLGSPRVTLMFTLPSINLAAQKITPLFLPPLEEALYFEKIHL